MLKIIRSEEQGFTLVELLIVFSFIGILTSLGIAAYSSYSGIQSVNSAAIDVETLLNTAKARSISQVIPSSCGTNSLTAYEVDVTPNGQQYTLYAVCGSKQVISTDSLPPRVTFSNGSTASTIFGISNGTANVATIIVTGYGKTQTISVSQTGSVTVN